MQSDDMEQKQCYLRKEILEKHYDPQKFIQFLDSRLSIGDDLSRCSINELKSVVQDFIKLQRLQDSSEVESSPVESMEESKTSIAMQKSNILQKPRPVLFTQEKYNFTQLEFSKNYTCIKVNPKLSNKLRCEVCNPQRKQVGGFFGIGATSFLQFEVRTPEMNWVVGRRYSDFVWLRAFLRKMYPTQIVPPIPEKKASKRTQRHVEKRMRILTYFLNDLIGIPEFRNNKMVEGFLKIRDGSTFVQMKADGDKMKPNTTVDHVETQTGQVTVNFSLENKAYMDQIKKFMPEMERLYKQITRQGKALQAVQTDEVNTLYQMGNLFAELHEKSRDLTNRVPKATGINKLNELFVALNNMTIEWGNLIRSQYQIIEKNFNTFFKYVRNDLHGYLEIFALQAAAEEEFCKGKLALDKKKEKIYQLYDATKWDLPKEKVIKMDKEIVHDKARAFQAMLPKDNKDLEHLRINNALYVSQLFENGNQNFRNSADKFQQNFKEWSINLKVNTQQVVELWNEMSQSFSGERQIKHLKEKPLDMDLGDQIMED